MIDEELQKIALNMPFHELANKLKAVANATLAVGGKKYDPKKVEAWAIHRAAAIRDRARGKP